MYFEAVLDCKYYQSRLEGGNIKGDCENQQEGLINDIILLKKLYYNILFNKKS